MADRPIIFSAPMVRALVDGRKTMTRRLAYREPSEEFLEHVSQVSAGVPHTVSGRPSPWQRVQPGDRLYVREAGNWLKPTPCAITGGLVSFIAYSADGNYGLSAFGGKLRPSIHMPRWASRLTLTVTAVRVERLQDISAGDAIREGIAYPPKGMTMDEACEYGVDPRGEFRILWNRLHGPDAWDANPEVVCIGFDVRMGNIDA